MYMQQQVLSPGGEIFIWERRSGIIGKDEAGVYCQGATTRLSRLFGKDEAGVYSRQNY